MTIHFMHYDFCRIHKSLCVTRAIEAGIAERLDNRRDYHSVRKRMNQSETPHSEEDPDAKALSERFPLLGKIGDRLSIPSGPLAGEPVIIRRKLTERGGVIFTMKYDDGRIKEWEWFD